MKKKAITLLKIGFSLALVIYLFAYKIDLMDVLRDFANVHVGWLIAGASLHLTGLLISAVRWKILLAAQSISQPISRLVSYYLVGHFFNMFLPTKIGGDVIRIYDTSRDHGSTAQPLAVVLVERISGLLTMLLLAALVLLFNVDIGFDYRSHIPGLNLGIGVFLLALLVFPLTFHPRIEGFLFGVIFKLPVLNKLSGFVGKIYKAFQVFGSRLPHLGGALFAGLLLQINYFFHYYFLARALGMDDIGFLFFFVIIPIRSVTLMIPFFINGIGLREFFDVTAFGLVAGITRSQAVAFSELAWFIQIAFALVGGVVYALRKRQSPVTDTHE